MLKEPSGLRYQPSNAGVTVWPVAFVAENGSWPRAGGAAVAIRTANPSETITRPLIARMVAPGASRFHDVLRLDRRDDSREACPRHDCTPVGGALVFRAGPRFLRLAGVRLCPGSRRRPRFEQPIATRVSPRSAS